MGGFGTTSVAIATAPTVISTFLSHILSEPGRRRASKKRRSAKGDKGKHDHSEDNPTDDITYKEGLEVVRRFIEFSSHYGVEEVQAFTAMQVPTPHWVRRKVVTIPDESINKAEEILTEHLKSYGPDGGGIQLVGGEKWWRVRGRALEGEWVELQKDYLMRKARQEQAEAAAAAEAAGISPVESQAASSSRYRFLPSRSATLGSVKDSTGGEVIGDRVLLYVHGGAFFFSSLDTHRYQVQRHARKAGARAFCPAYRLAPQYPFPCALLDALAAYLYLLSPPPGTHAPISPTSIIFMGDSAGGGLCISLLVLIREMGLPMPAGASLISPWVDLTHSMPSITGEPAGDFIPATGFHYKPSLTWPPLPGDGIGVRMPNGEDRVYDEQVQMYCPNNLLTHPLVSPVNQGSLGGLCPLLILGGGGELLRDEIIYLAHKASNPALYPPSRHTLRQYPDQEALVDKYPPTRVHLQVHEGACHVVPTLSWTRSAKHMYRACANFNIWAFTAASHALNDKLEKQEAHQHHHPHLHRDHYYNRHEHHHHHSSRKGSGEKDTSRSSTHSSAPSGPAKLNTNLGITSITDPTTSTTTPTDYTPSSTQPNSGLPSTNPSLIDLTKPIIDPSASAAANTAEIDNEDLESECSTSSDESDSESPSSASILAAPMVSVTGTEPNPPPNSSIVSERVSIRGRIRPFEPIDQVPALHPELRDHIGQVHPEGAIQKWVARRAEWDDKYSSSLKKWREVRKEDRVQAEKEGFLTRDLKGERPPLASLAGMWDVKMAREIGKSVDEIDRRTSKGVMMWMKMSSKADKEQSGGDTLGEIKQNVQAELEEREHEAEVENQDGGGGNAGSPRQRDRRRSSVGTRGRRRSSVAGPRPVLGGHKMEQPVTARARRGSSAAGQRPVVDFHLEKPVAVKVEPKV